MAKFRKILGALLILYVGLMGGLLAVMRQPVLFGKVMRHMPEPAFFIVPFKQLWFIARAGKLKVGDPAPDFNLTTGDKKSFVKLSAFRGRKPVVLIFGSYT